MTGFPSSASFKPTEVQSGIALAPLAKWLSGMSSPDHLNKLSDVLERFRTPASYHRIDLRITYSSELPPSPSEPYASLPDDLEQPIEVDTSPAPAVDAEEGTPRPNGDAANGDAPVGEVGDKADVGKTAAPEEGADVTMADAMDVDATGTSDAAQPDQQPTLAPSSPPGDAQLPVDERASADGNSPQPSTRHDSQPPPEPSEPLPRPPSAIRALADYPSPRTPATGAVSPGQDLAAASNPPESSTPAAVPDPVPATVEAAADDDPANPTEPSLEPSAQASPPNPSSQPAPDITESKITLALIALGAVGTVPPSKESQDKSNPTSRAQSPVIPDYPPPPGPTSRCVRELRLDLRTLDPAALFELENWRRKELGLRPLAMSAPDSVWYKVPSDSESPPPKHRRGRPSKSKTTASASVEPRRRSATGDDDVTLLGTSRPRASTRDRQLNEAVANGTQDIVSVCDRTPTPDLVLPDGFDADGTDDPDFVPPEEQRARRGRLPRVPSPEVDLPRGLETEEEEVNNASQHHLSSSMPPDEFWNGFGEGGANGQTEADDLHNDDPPEPRLGTTGTSGRTSTSRELSGERAIDALLDEAIGENDAAMQSDREQQDGDELLFPDEGANEEEEFNNALDDEEEFGNELPDEEEIDNAVSDEEAAFNDLVMEEDEDEDEDGDGDAPKQPPQDEGDLYRSDHQSPQRSSSGEAVDEASPDGKSRSSEPQRKSSSKTATSPAPITASSTQRGRGSVSVTLARRYKTPATVSSSSRARLPVPVSVRKSTRGAAASGSDIENGQRSPSKRIPKRSASSEIPGTPEPTQPPRRSRTLRASNNNITPEPVPSRKRAMPSSPNVASTTREPTSSGRRTRALVAAGTSSPPEPVSVSRPSRATRSSNNFAPPEPVASIKQPKSSTSAKPNSSPSEPASTGRRTRAVAAVEEQHAAPAPTPSRRTARPYVVLDLSASPSPPRRPRASAVHFVAVEVTEAGPSRRRRARSPTVDEDEVEGNDAEPADISSPPKKRVRLTQMARRSKPLPAPPSTRARPASSPTPPPRMVMDGVYIPLLSAAERAQYTRMPMPEPVQPSVVSAPNPKLPTGAFAPARWQPLQVEPPKTPIVQSLARSGEPRSQDATVKKLVVGRATVKRIVKKQARDVEPGEDEDDEWSAFKF